LVLDQRVDAIGISARDGDADLAVSAGRQPRIPGDLRPGLAAVGRLEEPAAGAAAGHLVLDAVRLPQCGIHHVRILRIDRNVDRAGPGITKQLPLPGLAAVDALEDAALVARRAVLAEVGDEDDVWIGRM